MLFKDKMVKEKRDESKVRIEEELKEPESLDFSKANAMSKNSLGPNLDIQKSG